MMSDQSEKKVVIIGAGLAGLTLAIALSPKNSSITIYELRARSHHHGGAIMLSPNSLRLFDKLGVYDRIRSKGFNFEKNIMVKDAEALKYGDGGLTEKPQGEYLFGSEKMYGYKALRIYRQVIIDELLLLLRENGVNVVFEKKYQSVVEENGDGVKVGFGDGEIVNAAVLIGTDGIHSKVREYITPTIKPKFTGTMSVVGAVETRHVSNVSLDSPISIFGSSGVYIVAPQDVDGSELMAGTQCLWPEQDQAGWRLLSSSPETMKGLQVKGRENWLSPIIKASIDHILPASMYVWPFYVIPDLPSWTSPQGKVLILGDAAHAIPPTLGQGANQAVEDAYSLALLLADPKMQAQGQPDVFAKAMKAWQLARQERIGILMEMTRKMNNNRLPVVEKEKLPGSAFWKPDTERPGEEMRWLYDFDVEGMVGGILNPVTTEA